MSDTKERSVDYCWSFTSASL